MPLDPTSFARVVKIYQENIDSLIDNMGKEVSLHFYPNITDVTTEFHDAIRGVGSRKPIYKATEANPAPQITEITRIIKALTEADPQNFDSFGDIHVQNANMIIQLKTYLSDVPDLIRCEYIVPNLDAEGIVNMRFKLVRTPVPKGLQINRYAISYWANI